MKTDVEIDQELELYNINEIAKQLNIPEDKIETYGPNKAKIDLELLNQKQDVCILI